MSSATTNSMVNVPFSLPGKIYTGALPKQSSLPGFGEELTNKKISTVLMLCTEKESGNLKKWYEEKGLKVIHYPINDCSIPTDVDNFNKVLESVRSDATQGENIFVHCRTGAGRTGMVVACLAKKRRCWKNLPIN